VWPNPAKERLSFRFGTENLTRFTLVDFLGRPVLVQESANGEGFFALKNLPPGIYVLEGQSKPGAFSRQKIVVE
jgi:hypothetical protein